MTSFKKETETIDAAVLCPDCGSDDAVLRFSRKRSQIQVQCSDCDHLEEHIVPYGAGVIATDNEKYVSDDGE